MSKGFKQLHIYLNRYLINLIFIMNINNNSKNVLQNQHKEQKLAFYAGAFSGLCQMVIGHPLDTMKVRIQNHKPLKGLRISDYYKGVVFPTISGMIINSIVFGSYNYFKNLTGENIVSGFAAGATVSPVAYLFDIGKTKKQISERPTFSMIFNNKGLPVSVMREAFAFSVYFSTYEYMREKHNQSVLLSGALAGLANWTFTYPLDVIRNRQIALNIPFTDAFNMGRLFSGYAPCAARALIVNAVGFYTYEQALEKARTIFI